jgi:hypothetical protein
VASLAAFVPDTILEQDGGIVGQRVTKWKLGSLIITRCFSSVFNEMTPSRLRWGGGLPS